MKIINLSFLLGRYLTVGLGAALIHGIVLLLLSQNLTLWISNLIAFLTASITSYLGHAKFTFRKDTKGKKFAKRWLLLQYIINLFLSALLPNLIESLLPKYVITFLLIFTPTVVNALIWNSAKNHSITINKRSKCYPQIHADDFGIADATNNAIISLKKDKKLDSASLLVTGSSLEEAISLWNEESNFPLCLHLCLTEGSATGEINKINLLADKSGLLKLSFMKLLLISFFPENSAYKKNIKLQLTHEIESQIKSYKKLTGLNSISIDGHQHIHLIPLILEIIINLSKIYSIEWIRTTSEPLPIGVPLKDWLIALKNGGLVKWLILQILSTLAKPNIKKENLLTNSKFAGVLFTGRMTQEALSISYKKLEKSTLESHQSQPLILSHPSYELKIDEGVNNLKMFPLSSKFLQSKWRAKELKALEKWRIRKTI